MTIGIILSASVSDIDSGSLANAPWSQSTSDSSNFVGGVYGDAVLHSSLASPLTNSGNYCRVFSRSSLTPYGFWLVNSSVDSGIYTGPYSTTKAYSLRAWIRKESGGTVRDSGIGLFARNVFDGTTNSINYDANAYNITPGGYNVQYSQRVANAAGSATQNATSGNASLWLQARQTNNPFNPAAVIECSGSTNQEYLMDTWHRIRMDVIPLGTSGDTINVYTSSAGDVTSGNETWELVGTTFVNSTDAYYVDPTSGDLQMGFYSFCTNSTGARNMYIDQFEVLVKDIS